MNLLPVCLNGVLGKLSGYRRGMATAGPISGDKGIKVLAILIERSVFRDQQKFFLILLGTL